MLDVYLGGAVNGRCDGMSRRDFVRVGTLAGFGLSLPNVLAAEARAGGNSIPTDPAAADTTNRQHSGPTHGGPGPTARAKSTILIFLGGGLSHHDSFDLKPEAPAEIRGVYQSIPTTVPGLRIGERLPMMARVMDKVALVRSGSHNNDHHETATNWVLSGRFGSPFGDHPAMGAVVAQQLGFPANHLPPYVAVPRNPSFTWELGKSAYLGGRYESFKAGDPAKPDFRVRDLTPAQEMSTGRSSRRASLLAAVDGLARRIEGNDQLTTYGEFHQRAADMVLSGQARAAFAIEQESDKLRDRYGRNTFGQSCLLARRLAEAGVRFVTVNFGGWDHHAKIFPSLDKMLPELDAGLSALVSDMDSRGSLSDTLVAVFGEFGRTPKLNKDAGRDHWGQAASLLFFGAGVRGGLVLGRTDRTGSEAIERPVRPADVAATLYEAIGVNPRNLLQQPDGRPMEILDIGEPVQELFA